MPNLDFQVKRNVFALRGDGSKGVIESLSKTKLSRADVVTAPPHFSGEQENSHAGDQYI
ncbi:MAG TPA: hypothetical protein VGS12_15895 [Caulobacteraceae bacterium]|nr:hypothetical protein [Caulobacteraceae bacterium]